MQSVFVIDAMFLFYLQPELPPTIIVITSRFCVIVLAAIVGQKQGSGMLNDSRN